MEGADREKLEREYLASLPSAETLIRQYSDQGLKAKELTRIVADELHLPKRDVYDLYLKIKDTL